MCHKLWEVWNKVNQTQHKEPKMFLFFLSLLFESCRIFQQDKKGHDHNMERFLCCWFFLFCLHFLTTDTPPLKRWPFSMVSQASHIHTNTTNRQTHAPTQTHTHTHSYRTSIQAIKKKRQQIERRKGREKRRDNLADAGSPMWCSCRSDDMQDTLLSCTTIL